MTNAGRYAALFDPVPLGPVTAPNRFYQVPHCTGMGNQLPRTLAAMRETKAEGGWGVVCTEYCSIHPTSDDSPLRNASLWDDDDVRAHALMVDKVHRHGSLAAVQLWHGGSAESNLFSREVTLGVDSRPPERYDPVQSRAMDRADIRELRRWHREAALRAQRAGFDIIYVYATHGYLLSQFLSPDNQRSDEYGGCLENRVRLVRELLEETKEAVGDRCAVAVRISTDAGEIDGQPDTTEQSEVIGLLADLPDLWDVNIQDYTYEMGTSRFVHEAALESYVRHVKQLTDKPVVGVGRFTSPDTMLRLVNTGVLDLIGCARPSIADPFLPNKIREGRVDDIRECIGCNICYASNSRSVPLLCTQNPTMGEEWRKGWHPESIPARAVDRRILVIGGGPTGLEAARALGQRGYRVVLADRDSQLGGRVNAEARLPGLAEWARVRDWRVGQIEKMSNVEVFLESELDADQIRDVEADRIVFATGARWRSDGVGRAHSTPIDGWQGASVLTPDDVMAGAKIVGPVLLFDDDHYYLGGVLAEKLASEGHDVRLVTPASLASAWTYTTAELARIQTRLLGLGVTIDANTTLTALAEGEATLGSVFTNERRSVAAGTVVMVTSRAPLDSLARAIATAADAADSIDVARIGDCLAPGTIAACVYAGHRYARELDAAPPADVPFRREAPDC